MISLMFLGENRNCHNPVINLAQLLISGLAVAAVLLAAFPLLRLVWQAPHFWRWF